MTFNFSPTRAERERRRRQEQRRRRVIYLVSALLVIGLIVGIVFAVRSAGRHTDRAANDGTAHTVAAGSAPEPTGAPVADFAQLNAERLTSTAQARRPSVTPPPPPRTPTASSRPLRTPTPLPGPANGTDQEAEIVRLVNAARVAEGLSELTINPLLTQAAQRQSDDMALGDFLDHTGSDGSTPHQRILDTGYPAWATGENILYQPDVDAAQAFDAWWNSKGHHDNMMNPQFSEIGVAYRVFSSSRVYYAMTLGSQR